MAPRTRGVFRPHSLHVSWEAYLSLLFLPVIQVISLAPWSRQSLFWWASSFCIILADRVFLRCWISIWDLRWWLEKMSSSQIWGPCMTQQKYGYVYHFLLLPWHQLEWWTDTVVQWVHLLVGAWSISVQIPPPLTPSENLHRRILSVLSPFQQSSTGLLTHGWSHHFLLSLDALLIQSRRSWVSQILYVDECSPPVFGESVQNIWVIDSRPSKKEGLHDSYFSHIQGGDLRHKIHFLPNVFVLCGRFS